jgi:hypothetical protein
MGKKRGLKMGKKRPILEVTENHFDMMKIDDILDHFEKQLRNETGEEITPEQRKEISSLLYNHPILRILSGVLESYGYDSF